MSLNRVYEVGLKHALENIKRNGGMVNGDQVTIKMQSPEAVRFEKSFDGLFPVLKKPVGWSATKDEIHFAFEGTGFALPGDAITDKGVPAHIFHTELYIDGKLMESPVLPTAFHDRRHELCWNYDLPKGHHEVRLKILNPAAGAEIRPGDVIIYSDQPFKAGY
jgi:hypothetical protein